MTTVATVLFVALVFSLGRWQLDRAQEKQSRQALLDRRVAEAPLQLTGMVPSAEPLLYRRVRAAGRWLPERQIYIDNQIREGRAGFHVITPLAIEDRREAVLVNRGWIARDAQYPRAPRVEAPPGRVEVEGVAALPPARFLELTAHTVAGDVWQNLSLARYREATGLEVLPVVVLASEPAPGLAPVRERPDAGAAKHEEYAFTWFALGATALALWLGLNLRRRP